MPRYWNVVPGNAPDARLGVPLEPANVLGLDGVLDQVDRALGEFECPNRVVGNDAEADLRDSPMLGSAGELHLAIGRNSDDAVGAGADPHALGRG